MKRVFTLFLSFLMLITNVTFTFGTHYCGGKAVKTRLLVGSDALGCGMVEKEDTCEHAYDKAILNQKKCCEDKFQQISLENDFKAQKSDKSLINKHVSELLSSPCIQIHSKLTQTVFVYKIYTPPIRVFDIPVLVQSFLI